MARRLLTSRLSIGCGSSAALSSTAAKIQSMDWVTGLSPLEALAIENFKRVLHLDPLESLTSLTALGIEGSIWTRMRVATLAPLSGLRGLLYLFLTNLTASDRSLHHLHSLTGLEVCRSALCFPTKSCCGFAKRCQGFAATGSR